MASGGGSLSSDFKDLLRVEERTLYVIGAFSKSAVATTITTEWGKRDKNCG
jgi:hypothetical protein